MNINRRHFLKFSGALAVSSFAGRGKTAHAARSHASSATTLGCLVDTTLCVGCRSCEEACNQRHGLPRPHEPFNEMAVLESPRRPDEISYTVINKYYPRRIGTLTWKQRPTFVKFQCMHCNDPSCASACIVGALSKKENGAIVYDPGKCIGCRYCMVACPFQIPAYEYSHALAPQVRKCNFCFEEVNQGGLPACAQVCPKEAISFGKREDLLHLAQWKMKNNPGKYVDHIYGQHEVGGTSWLYLASEPFHSIGFPKLGVEPPPRLTEAIQHGVFQYMAAPIGLYIVLGSAMWVTRFYGKYVERQKSNLEDSNEPRRQS
ncbi:MAG: 4Fe-4S dicluster domain-containing protein [Desulfobacteraceae bacterium]|nr:MAG: 4Fe-4S dicluster domain-containing protein [Desulfobacteraceae bacterium]